jgi:uncharacterized protein (TIGR02145 family)
MKEVKIGKQIWMDENLNVDKFRNGDPIAEAKTDEEWLRAHNNKKPAWCYYENISSHGKIYGKLYNWFAVNDKRGLAPIGWLIPSDEDWTTLTDYLGGNTGLKLKSKNGWELSRRDVCNNKLGFSGLPGGCRGNYEVVEFDLLGFVGLWWSSTEHSDNSAIVRELNYDSDDHTWNYCRKGNGVSVRCLKK